MEERSNSPIIWVLADEMAGNVSQVLGVAEQLGLPFIRKDIRYTKWAKLPNVVLGASLKGIDKERSSPFDAPWPDLVIAAGRRTSPVARYIRQKSGKKTKLVQIMWPGFGSGTFDLLVVPEHDNIHFSSNSLLKILGAPHRVTEARLTEERKKWYPHYSHLPARKIALLVGGSVGKNIFSAEHAELLAKNASSMAKEAGAGLLVTTSRRTPKEAVEALKKEIDVPCEFYQWGDKSENPYFGLLALADIIIATGDSVSMCSEACATGKPVYLFVPKGTVTAKHKRFHTQLIESGCARMLSEKYDQWHYIPINEAGRIASAIRTMLGFGAK